MGCTSLRGPVDKMPLVGIARLAAQSPLVRERAEVEYFRLEARSALNRETRMRGISVSTASDEDFLYVWKSNAKIAK